MANFIHECAKKINSSQNAINTAIIFFHRFYMLYSLQQYDKYDIALACLFLAGKRVKN